MSSNKIQLRKGFNIGESCAEDDNHFLSKCFIQKGELEQILNLDNNYSILLGRTGSGKTALLNRIDNTQVEVLKLDPAELFFQYVSNSKTFEFFIGLGANLDVVFSMLWKHVILIESVKLYYESRSAFERSIAGLRAPERSLKRYLDEWDNEFWSNSEISMKELVTKMEASLTTSAKVDVNVVKLGGEAAGKFSVDEKVQIRQNILAAVNNPLTSHLNKAISNLNKLTESRAKEFYILLDELDESWIVSEYKFRLIRALIESIRKFRKVRKFKVVVAMRNDLYDRAILETSDSGYQAEKHSGLIVKLNWSSHELFELTESRIQEMFEYRYTKKSIRFNDVFPKTIRKVDAFQYIIERTMMRPRDLIEFINTIFQLSEGTSLFGKDAVERISQKKIMDAEEIYSAGRKQALIDEWTSIHPHMAIYIDILASLKESFDFENTAVDERVDDIALKIVSDDTQKVKDRVYVAAETYLNADTPANKAKFKQEVFATLYKVGVISAKTSARTGFKDSFGSTVTIAPISIGLETSFKIKPMFWRVLGVTPNIGS